MKIELEHRHSDYGPKSGGYTVIRINGRWLVECEDIELAKQLISYVEKLEEDNKSLKIQLDAANLGWA